MSVARAWRGDPAEIVAAFDRVAVRRELLDRIGAARPDWHTVAACAGADLEVFFPPLGRTGSAAKQICATCPVRAECLAEALADPDLDHGVRGGLSARERARLRTGQRRRHHRGAS